jgi:hypothetical protein
MDAIRTGLIICLKAPEAKYHETIRPKAIAIPPTLGVGIT